MPQWNNYLDTLAYGNGDSVEYTYDDAGNILSRTEYAYTTGSLASTVGAANPLRYRGYVYDQETELYYLQSRYYRPEWGRFINADGLVSTGQGFVGNNMFAYCLNNPVILTDPNGMCTYTGYAPWISPTVTYLDCGKTTCPTSKNYIGGIHSILTHLATPSNNDHTFSVGVSAGTTAGGITQGKSGCLSVDSSNNYAFQETTSYGAGMGVGVSAGLVLTYTNATYVTDLAGTSESVGGTICALGGIVFDYITFIPASNPTTTCWGVSVTISGGGEFEAHSAYNYTTSTEPWNLWLALRKLLYGD